MTADARPDPVKIDGGTRRRGEMSAENLNKRGNPCGLCGKHHGAGPCPHTLAEIMPLNRKAGDCYLCAGDEAACDCALDAFGYRCGSNYCDDPACVQTHEERL